MTVLPSPIANVKQLDALIDRAWAVHHEAQRAGLHLVSPFFPHIPRVLFREVPVPAHLQVGSGGKVYDLKEYRGLTLYCDEPETDIPEFAVLLPVERAAPVVEPTVCCTDQTRLCPVCDAERYDPDEAA